MSDTMPKPFVFVLMPFASEFDDLYRLGIKPACEKAGAYAERVDEQLFQESILNRIYNQIAKAEVIVADMSGRNENVFYETGYAHALGKTVILLTKDSADIPFDLKHFPHLVYGGRISDLLPELEKRVRWALRKPGQRGVLPSGLKVYHNGLLLESGSSIEFRKLDTPWLPLVLDINNAEEDSFETARFEWSLISPPEYRENYAAPEKMHRYPVVNCRMGAIYICLGGHPVEFSPRNGTRSISV